jgi:calcineurin-like phosphoesterase family protein
VISAAARPIGALASIVTICVFVGTCADNSPVAPSSPPGSPIPAPPLSSEVFVGAGDIGVCGSGATVATARLLDSIPGTVFTAGDNAYQEGTAQQFLDCYDPTWGRQKSRTRPAPGNHEYASSPVAAPYFEYFGFAAGPPGLGYYSFDLGAWHAISLNSNIGYGLSSAQVQWLRADLGSNQAKCTLAYWHHPRFSSGPNGSHAEMQDFWRVLYAAGVEIIVNAHDHLYERFAPQDPDGVPDPIGGIRQFVAGTGGAHLYDVVQIKANSEVRVRSFGVLKLTLEPDSYRWEFIPVAGAGDSGTGMCH